MRGESMRKLACFTTSSRYRTTTIEMAEETHVLVTRVAKTAKIHRPVKNSCSFIATG